MAKFLLWLILLVLCWPLAILALVLYPFVWLLLLPFRLVGIAVTGATGRAPEPRQVAEDHVRGVGDPVALVAADSREIAEELAPRFGLSRRAVYERIVKSRG